MIDPRGPEAPAALRRWRAEGVTGIRLRPLRESEHPGRGPWLGTAETLPLWEAIAETGTIACVLHAGADLGRLPPLLARFPSLRVVIDHLNNPAPAQGLGQPAFRPLLDLARHPQVHVALRLPSLVPGALSVPGRPAVRRGRRPRFRGGALHVGIRFPSSLAGCGYVRSRYLCPGRRRSCPRKSWTWSWAGRPSVSGSVEAASHSHTLERSRR